MILDKDIPAASVVLDVLTEATSNASKHGTGGTISCSIERAGNTLTVRATSPITGPAPVRKPSTRLGFEYLRELTQKMTFYRAGNENVLEVVVPIRDELSLEELSSR